MSVITVGQSRAQRAALSLRFHAINIPQTSAKESKIRLAVYGLTINVSPNLDLLKDVAAFVKAPPGVRVCATIFDRVLPSVYQAFETVVPSERTRLSLTVSESSIRVTPLSRPNALILSLSDIGFSTDLVGNSSHVAFTIFGGGMSVFLMDDCSTLPKKEDFRHRIFSDAEYWMVCIRSKSHSCHRY